MHISAIKIFTSVKSDKHPEKHETAVGGKEKDNKK